MSNPSTTTILPDAARPRRADEPRRRWYDTILQRDRLWLLLILLIIAALFLGGCHARAQSCGGHASGCGADGADGALAIFYVAYVLVWIIASAAGG